MRRSNYNLRFGPTFDDRGNPPWSMRIELTPEFRDFLRSSKVDKKYYENLAFETMKKCGWQHITRRLVRDSFCGNICGWNRGLITKVQVFGSAAGLYFDDNPVTGPLYVTHNIGSYSHLVPVLTVMTDYLFRAECAIPRQSI